MAMDLPLLLIDRNNAEAHEHLLRKFEQLYVFVFRDSDTREDPAVWSKLFAKDSPNCYDLYILLCLDSSRTNVLGGAVFEFYNASRCALLAYLVVDEKHRGQGIASVLSKEVKRNLSTYYPDTRILFAETNTHVANESFNEYNNRIGILQHLGFRFVDIPYVQPPLNGGNKVDSLMLLCKSINGEPVEKDAIEEYLGDFYTTLGIDAPEADDGFVKMINGLKKLEHLNNSCLDMKPQGLHWTTAHCPFISVRTPLYLT